MKNIRCFYLKFSVVLEVIFSTYLNRRVFVMRTTDENVAYIYEYQHSFQQYLLHTVKFRYQDHSKIRPLRDWPAFASTIFFSFVFYFSLKNMSCRYSFEAPHRGASNKCYNMFCCEEISKNLENYKTYLELCSTFNIEIAPLINVKKIAIGNNENTTD